MTSPRDTGLSPGMLRLSSLLMLYLLLFPGL